MSEHISARAALLDAQIVDCDRLPVGRVDDLELRFPGEGRAPEVARILTGSQALGERVGGALGRSMASISARLRDPGSAPGPSGIDPALVAEVMPMLRLSAAFRDLAGVAMLERWLTDRFVGQLPGTGSDASQ